MEPVTAGELRHRFDDRLRVAKDALPEAGVRRERREEVRAAQAVRRTRNLHHRLGRTRAVAKRRALQEILDMKDPKAFLAKSGWHPGIGLR